MTPLVANGTLMTPLVANGTLMTGPSLLTGHSMDSDSPFMIMVHIIDVLLGVVAVVGNGFAVVVFVRNPHLRRMTNHHIISLTIADMLSGALSPLFTYITDNHMTTPYVYCLLMCSGLSYFYSVQLCNLVCVSVNRWERMFHTNPNPHQKVVTIVTLVISWVYPSVIACLPVMGWVKSPPQSTGMETELCAFRDVMSRTYMMFIFFAIVVPSFVVMSSLYIHIYRLGRRRIEILEELELPYDRYKELKRELGVIRFVYVLVAVCAVCWLPLFISDTLVALGSVTYDRNIIYCLVLLAHTNAAVNPLLYAFTYQEFKEAARPYFCKGRENLEISSTEVNRLQYYSI